MYVLFWLTLVIVPSSWKGIAAVDSAEIPAPPAYLTSTVQKSPGRPEPPGSAVLRV